MDVMVPGRLETGKTAPQPEGGEGGEGKEDPRIHQDKYLHKAAPVLFAITKKHRIADVRNVLTSTRGVSDQHCNMVSESEGAEHLIRR
jgi:hypothetical protein